MKVKYISKLTPEKTKEMGVDWIGDGLKKQITIIAHKENCDDDLVLHFGGIRFLNHEIGSGHCVPVCVHYDNGVSELGFKYYEYEYRTRKPRLVSYYTNYGNRNSAIIGDILGKYITHRGGHDGTVDECIYSNAIKGVLKRKMFSGNRPFAKYAVYCACEGLSTDGSRFGDDEPNHRYVKSIYDGNMYIKCPKLVTMSDILYIVGENVSSVDKISAKTDIIVDGMDSTLHGI